MFKYLVLFCFGFTFLSHQQVSGQASYPVIRSEYLEHTLLKELYRDKQQLADIESALLVIEKFLREDDLSLIYADFATARIIRNNLKIIENPSNNLFEIVAITSVTDKTIIFTVNSYLYFEKAHVQLYKSSFKIGFAVEQKKVLFPIYHPDYITKKYQNISFHVNKTLAEIYRSNMLKADAYVSNFLAYVKGKYSGFNSPVKQLNYIISDGYFNSLEYFSIQNYFNTSQNLANNIILDVTAKGFYTHELIHYIFSTYKMKSFLNEGLATLFSGGKGRFESVPITEWNAIRKGIRSDEKYRAVFDHTDSLFDGAYAHHEMYFVSAVLLHQYYLKQGDKIFFRQLFEKLVPLTNKEVLALIKKELGITTLSTYLESIDDNTWIAIKSAFDKF
ncbi:MAG: hypothetical protein V4557_19620 [Bacteroidota bacterium]